MVKQAHALQLCVKDGLKASSQIAAILHKAGCIVSHCHKSTLATEKAEELLILEKQRLPRMTRWSTQLKMVRRLSCRQEGASFKCI